MTSGYSEGGFEDRFRVTRVDRSPINAKARYLVLDYSGRDPHALIALYEYSKSVRADNPKLADDLFDAIRNPEAWPAQHD